MKRIWPKLKWHLRRWLSLKRFKKVTLIGMRTIHLKKQEGEVWGCNYCGQHNIFLDRLYAMDKPETLIEHQGVHDWLDLVIGIDYPVIMQQAYWNIPTSRPFPKKEVKEELGLNAETGYYTSTLAYMFADAIREGYGTIKIQHLLSFDGSPEYYGQKACMDFWYGVARAKGITVEMDPDCLVGKPYFWQPGMYGYDELPPDYENMVTMLHHTIKAMLHLAHRGE